MLEDTRVSRKASSGTLEGNEHGWAELTRQQQNTDAWPQVSPSWKATTVIRLQVRAGVSADGSIRGKKGSYLFVQLTEKGDKLSSHDVQKAQKHGMPLPASKRSSCFRQVELS